MTTTPAHPPPPAGSADRVTRAAAGRPAYPAAARGDTVDDVFGRRVPDPYRALEDNAEPGTRDWAAAQDRLFVTQRRRWGDPFARRLAELYAAESVMVPVWYGQRLFRMRHFAGAEHEVLCTAAPGEPERVLFDPAVLDPSGRTTLDAWQPSRDGTLVACQLSVDGTEQCALRVLDTAGGTFLDDRIEGCRRSPIAWLPGARGFYHTRGAERGLWLHRLGDPPGRDRPIVGDASQRVYDVRLDATGRRLIVVLADGPGRPDRPMLADLAQAPPERPSLRPVLPPGVARTRAEMGPDGRLYLLTDLDAPRRRLCIADPADPLRTRAELIAEDPEAVLTGFAVLDRGHLLVLRTRQAVGELALHRADSGAHVREVALPGAGTITGLSVRPGGHETWVGYTDLLTPPTALRHDVRTGSPVDPTAPTRPRAPVRRVHYRSPDGTDVGMFLITPPTRAPARRTTPRPTLLTGYGGFGVSLAPTYRPDVLAWVEAGGVYAIAAVRGGGERGAAWHRAGMREHKQNSFDDFHAAAEWLIEHGWTTRSRLGAVGGSNGGLLVGAALTQRPDLFRAIVCLGPVLDMVRYERFGLGRLWRAEYGSSADPNEAAWLLDYSPYHRVRTGTAYPAALFAVFEGDTRVDPAHARKMCAALQHATTSTRPILLRREHGAGHGNRAVSRMVALDADTLAFLAHHLDPADPAPAAVASRDPAATGVDPTNPEPTAPC
ncbi:prolyl oligopeptidase family protein [Embleya sp. NPDC059213]|uniref:prolyl oligopeptidase family serine peptidase n=1 Tax=Embleya sp. NPDC059213 TaxID=3346771 RepID=UPI0036C7B37B